MYIEVPKKHMGDVIQHQLIYKFISLLGRDLTLHLLCPFPL